VHRNLPWWREVFLLAAGSVKSTPSLIANLINYLLPDAPATTAVLEGKAAEASLSAQALIETDFMDQVRRQESEGGRGSYAICFDRVQRWLVTALRADPTVGVGLRADCGRALARLRDPRDEVLDCDAMRLCLVPKGPFWLGSGDGDEWASGDEKVNGNAQRYDLDYDYWVGRFPVTNAQFAAFVKDHGYENVDYWGEAQAAGVWAEGVSGAMETTPRAPCRATSGAPFPFRTTRWSASPGTRAWPFAGG
jgi:hypothetical protein